MTIQITARNQDDAVDQAEEAALQNGYQRSSIRKTVSIVYEVELFDPIKEDVPEVAEPVQPQE